MVEQKTILEIIHIRLILNTIGLNEIALNFRDRQRTQMSLEKY